MDIYFQATSRGYDKDGRYGMSYKPYLIPTRKHIDGQGVDYDILGNKCLFAWVDPLRFIAIPESELPNDFIYSFKHGLDAVRRICTFEQTFGAFDRKPTKEEIFEAISQTRMYTHEDVLECQKKYRNYLGLKP